MRSEQESLLTEKKKEPVPEEKPNFTLA